MIKYLIPIFALLLAAGCAKPTTKVTLLPGKDGKIGKVVVKSEEASVELTKPYTFVSVTGEVEPIKIKKASPSQIKKDSKKLFVAEPEGTVHFILYFEHDSTTLTDSSRRQLTTIIDTIIRRRYAEVNIIGHTDTKGSDKHNRELSLRRARSVEKSLRSYYRDLKNAHIQSFGEKDPLIETGDNVSEPRNRRVEVMIR